MLDVNKIEDNNIELKSAVNTLGFINDIFENRIEEDYAEIMKEHCDIFTELKNFSLILQMLHKHFQTIHYDYQNQVENYYSELN